MDKSCWSLFLEGVFGIRKKGKSPPGLCCSHRATGACVCVHCSAWFGLLATGTITTRLHKCR